MVEHRANIAWWPRYGLGWMLNGHGGAIYTALTSLAMTNMHLIVFIQFIIRPLFIPSIQMCNRKRNDE